MKPGSPSLTNPNSSPSLKQIKLGEKVATAMPLTINYKTALSKQEESGVLPKTGQETKLSSTQSLWDNFTH